MNKSNLEILIEEDSKAKETYLFYLKRDSRKEAITIMRRNYNIYKNSAKDLRLRFGKNHPYYARYLLAALAIKDFINENT